MITRKKLQVLFKICSKRVCQIRVVQTEKKDPIKEQKKSFENTSDVIITKNGTVVKPLTIKKGKDPMTYNKKNKKNQREKL
jgi:hypothetical protein